jgi:hypothetical protein
MMAPCRKLALVLAVLSTIAVAGPAARADTIDLGQAGQYAVFQLGGTGGAGQLILNTSMIFGDVAIGEGGAQGDIQKTTINGTLFVDPQATPPDITGKNTVITGGINNSVQLNTAVQDAFNASSTYAALGGTPHTFGSTETINAGVYSTSAFNLNGVVLTINGTASQTFVVNVAGGSDFVFSQSQIVLTGGITASNVLFNVLGTGDSVTLQKSNSTFQGTLLAPNDKITLLDLGVNNTTGLPADGGMFGRVIGAFSQDLNIHSGAQVSIPEPSSVVLLCSGLVLLGIAGRRRGRQRPAVVDPA